MNGGSEQGGFGPFTTPDEVAAFMNALRNQLGGTNLHFTLQTTDHYLEPFGIASRQVISSKDTWVADNGTGSCDARWIHENGVWKMKSDVIMFTPSAAPVVDAEPVFELQAQVRQFMFVTFMSRVVNSCPFVEHQHPLCFCCTV